MKDKINIGLTGHRPNKLAGYNLNQESYRNLQRDLEKFIQAHLEINNKVICHSGLALGGDTVWSMAILSMRDKYPNKVEFHAEIPMLSQASVWINQQDIEYWYRQVEEADNKTIYGDIDNLSKGERKYKSIDLLNKRNKGMVDKLDILLTLWDGSKSGTYNTIKYAEEKGVKIYHIKLTNYFK